MLGQPLAYCLSIANASLRQALPSKAQARAIVVGLSPHTSPMFRSWSAGEPTLPMEMLDVDLAVVLAPESALVDLSPQPATTAPRAATAASVAAQRRGTTERQRDMVMRPPPVVAVPARARRDAPTRPERRAAPSRARSPPPGSGTGPRSACPTRGRPDRS